MGDKEKHYGVANGGTETVDLTQDGKDSQPEKPPRKKLSLKSRLKNREYRRNCLQTLWFGASFWALGFVFSQRGPAFLDLQIITNTDVEAASFFFTASSIGYLIGSFVAGFVYDKLNMSLLLLLYLMGMAVTTVAVPWCSIYALMVAIHFVFSLFGGGLETIGNAGILRLWGKEGEMAMQFIHFAYAFGGVIAPLATEPFLTPSPQDSDLATVLISINTTLSPVWELPTTSGNLTLDKRSKVFPATSMNSSTSLHMGSKEFQLFNDTNSSLSYGLSSVWNTTGVSVNVSDSLTSPSMPLTTRVHYAYVISGSIILSIMVPVTVQLFTDRSQKKKEMKKAKMDIKQPLPLRLFLFVQFTLCVFNFLSVSIEDTFASYLSAFVVKQVHWSKSWGAQVASLYWAMFATGRFLSIFAVHVFSSVKLLVINCFMLTISTLIFMLSAFHHVSIGVWVSSAMVGLFLAPVFPTGFSWMEEELVRVTGKVSSSITIAASAGSMSSPVVLGFLMQEFSPMWFSYLMLGEAAACLGVLLFLLALSRLYLRKRYTMEHTVHELPVPGSDEQEEMCGETKA